MIFALVILIARFFALSRHENSQVVAWTHVQYANRCRSASISDIGSQIDCNTLKHVQIKRLIIIKLAVFTLPSRIHDFAQIKEQSLHFFIGCLKHHSRVYHQYIVLLQLFYPAKINELITS